MKEYSKLTVDDFLASPVWVPVDDASGITDCLFVRPVHLRTPLPPPTETRILSASFSFADGSQASGFLWQDEENTGELFENQPVAICSGGHVSFWGTALAYEEDPLPARYLRLGGRTASEVFPMQYRSAVPLLQPAISGTLNGFTMLVVSRAEGMRVLK